MIPLRSCTPFLLAILFLPPALSSQVKLGCYQLDFQPWQPPMNIGGDTVFTVPPRTVELLALDADDSLKQVQFARGHYRHPVRESPPSSSRRPTWTTGKHQDELVLSWSNGFSGFGASVRPKGDTLRGNAETGWDFGRASQKASVRMWPIACPDL